MNVVILCGRLGRAPEEINTKSGMTICNMNLATSERKKDKDGNWGDATEWHKVVAFGKQAELCVKYLDKGSEVLLEGRIQTDSYDKDGETKYITKIIASHVQFIGGKAGKRELEDVGEIDSKTPATLDDDDYPF